MVVEEWKKQILFLYKRSLIIHETELQRAMLYCLAMSIATLYETEIGWMVLR